MTDIEFYETRYSGASGAFVRGFRTMYLGLCVNTLIMANVTLAIIKIFGVMLGFTQMQTLLISGTVTVLFTMIGGFSAVLWADFVLFIIAMAGSIAAAVVAHNLLGMAFGGAVGRLFGMDSARRRTLAIEVGMQNSGLAASLAKTHFPEMPLAAVPGALFSVWHNLSGALFAALCARGDDSSSDSAEPRG